MENRGNIGFLLYKDYYQNKENIFYFKNLKDIKPEDSSLRRSISSFFESKNKKIFDRKIEYKEKINEIAIESNIIEKKYYLEFKTIYPGLAIGLGYDIGIGAEGEFKNGFYFDWTTGFPLIPGSSVKGKLRSVFPLEEKELMESKLIKCHNDDKIKYLQELLKEIKGKDFEVEEIQQIKKEIFEGVNLKEERLRMCDRDIFFDAEIIIAPKQKFMTEDFLCPHKDELKNPVPLKILKILPETVFKFQFDLKGGKILSSEEKLSLFMRILLDTGIGAKTNVGYGQFDREYTERKYRIRLQHLENAEKIKEEKEFEKKLKEMSEIDRKLAIIDKEFTENKLMELYNKLDEFDDTDRIKVAEYIKIKFQELGKWNISIKKKKQYMKVKRIKETLNCN